MTGRVATMIGAIKLPGAVLEVAVSGDHLDFTLESRLEYEECELAAGNALNDGTAFAHVDLDADHAEGLVRLLRQAIEVRAMGLAATERGGGSGTVAR